LYDLAGDLDILLPRHEYEYIPRGKGKVYLENLLHSAVHIVIAGRLGVECLNWESTTGDREAGSTSIELGKLQNC
jgi:hypothetical protein